jgi:spore coat polysaccharide biosynthesis predicted glycosyltransferase SpsG
MRKVTVASEAYHNFVANDIDGVHKLVDYLESTSHVFFVKHIDKKTITLKKYIDTKYGSSEYGNTVLKIFKTVAISTLEMFNHGIVHNNLNSENIFINLKTFKPSITNFKDASDIKNDCLDLQNIIKSLGTLLYELWIQELPPLETPFTCEHLHHADANIPGEIKNFIYQTLSFSITEKNNFYNLLETLPQ